MRGKPSILFRILRSYISFWTDIIYYRKTYTIGKENIPSPGEPLILVSNHQNALNDALCMLHYSRSI